MTTPDPQVYLLHIRDRCEEVVQCRELRQQGHVPVSILFNAVCRNLEIIGEASRKIGPEFHAANPEVPWREMNALRNVLTTITRVPIRSSCGLSLSATSQCFW